MIHGRGSESVPTHTVAATKRAETTDERLFSPLRSLRAAGASAQKCQRAISAGRSAASAAPAAAGSGAPSLCRRRLWMVSARGGCTAPALKDLRGTVYRPPFASCLDGYTVAAQLEQAVYSYTTQRRHCRLHASHAYSKNMQCSRIIAHNRRNKARKAQSFFTKPARGARGQHSQLSSRAPPANWRRVERIHYTSPVASEEDLIPHPFYKTPLLKRGRASLLQEPCVIQTGNRPKLKLLVKNSSAA